MQLWNPTDAHIKEANLTHFIQFVNAKYQLNLANYAQLYPWSVEHATDFWMAVAEFCGLKWHTKPTQTVQNLNSFQNVDWFPGATLNFAENLLKGARATREPALIFWGEDKIKRALSWEELQNQVNAMRNWMHSIGIKPHMCIGFFMPNMPEAVVCLLAAASLGAICSLCSPDFGVQGVVDRFGQISPTLFIYADQSLYNGNVLHHQEKVELILKQLPTVTHLLEVNYFSTKTPAKHASYADVIAQAAKEILPFEGFAFSHPLYIMYSSGTTGVPKCIVHGAGGTMLQHLKEHQLHCNLKPEQRVFYYTTCGWMMWQWLVSALSSGCSLLLYDGSPFFPNEEILFSFIEQERANFFGVSAKYIDSVRKTKFIPKQKYALTHLQTIGSTGSPLVAEGFDFVYESIKKDVCLSSLSGGTDIVSCFVLGNPIGPVYRGEIQTRGLGMKVEVFNEQGQSVVGEKGELVCTLPFPSMPVSFWNDSEKKKYHASYFEKYENIWHHGDWMELTQNGGAIIYGRSDATLNPNGVRIGTAEIYRQVEQFEEILECVAVDQRWQGDTRIVLFVKMRPNAALTELLQKDIKQRLRTHCSPRHVPAKIVAIPDIPRTKSGKIMEIAVKRVIHQEPVQNKEAMANPEALAFFENLPQLAVE